MGVKCGLGLCGLAALAMAFDASAQNTAGVFGPVINEDDRGFEYRATYDPDSEDLRQRFHYQQAINGAVRWRVIGQVRKTADSDFDADYVRGEVVWQVTPDGQKYQTGFRVDARYRFDERPGDVTVHWTNQWKHIDDWTLRFIVSTTRQFSNNPADGLLIQTRAGGYTSLSAGPRVGLEVFSQYGSTSDWRSFDDQSHQTGPFAVFSLNDDWNLYTGILFGLTDATSDQELRFRIGRDF